MKKYLPIRVHHTLYGYGYWFGSRLYFWADGVVIVPVWAEIGKLTYAYSMKTVEHGQCNSWDDERSLERKLNATRRRFRIRHYEYALTSSFLYVVEYRKPFGCWQSLCVAKTYAEAQEKMERAIRQYLHYE